MKTMVDVTKSYGVGKKGKAHGIVGKFTGGFKKDSNSVLNGLVADTPKPESTKKSYVK